MPMIESSWMEKFKGRKFKLPSMGRVKGIIIQQRSRITKIKIRRKRAARKPRKGPVSPLRVWLVIHGAAMKKPRVMRPSMTF